MKLPRLHEVFMEADPPGKAPLAPGGSASLDRRGGDDRRQLTPPDPNRHAMKGQDVVKRLEASNAQNPVMFTTKIGPVVIWREGDRYLARHGKVSFDKAPIDSRGWDEQQLSDWMRQVGAMSLNKNEIKEILGVINGR